MAWFHSAMDAGMPSSAAEVSPSLAMSASKEMLALR